MDSPNQPYMSLPYQSGTLRSSAGQHNVPISLSPNINMQNTPRQVIIVEIVSISWFIFLQIKKKHILTVLSRHEHDNVPFCAPFCSKLKEKVMSQTQKKMFKGRSRRQVLMWILNIFSIFFRNWNDSLKFEKKVQIFCIRTNFSLLCMHHK